MSNKDSSQQIVIRKSNELIEARYKLTLEEQRLVLLLSSVIRTDDEDFKDYEIRVSDFVQMFGLEKRKAIYKAVEEAARELSGKKIDLSNGKERIYASWLSYVRYIEGSGVVQLRFDKSLKPYFLQLKNCIRGFTQYNLATVINFKSTYSIRLYELLKMEVWKAEKARTTQFEKIFEIEEYRQILGIDKKSYPIFADLKKRVIETTIKEISEQTDLNIAETNYIKTGRKITGIMFVVKIRQADEIQALQLEMEEEPPKEQPHPIIEQLISIGFAVETAQRYKTKYGIKRIERNIAYTLAKQQEGVVKDIPAYLNMAIKEDMGGGWEVAKTKAVEEKTQQQTVSNQREKQAELAHLQKMAEMARVPLETLLPKQPKGGN
jgi:plasmid replication initiation protein